MISLLSNSCRPNCSNWLLSLSQCSLYGILRHVIFIYPSFFIEFLVLSGGCQGNGNRFASREFCEAACGRRSGRRRRPQLGPLGSLPGVDICNLPVDGGDDHWGCPEMQISGVANTHVFPLLFKHTVSSWY